jgi:hypothetical protein
MNKKYNLGQKHESTDRTDYDKDEHILTGHLSNVNRVTDGPMVDSQCRTKK